MTDPQQQFFDNQDIVEVDIDDLFQRFIQSIDLVRSTFNAQALNSQEINTPQFQESRCHAFFRMIGFPVVLNDSNFHSPGYDPNLNVDTASFSSYATIDQQVVANRSLTNQLAGREDVFKTYRAIFAAGGNVAKAVALGSIFVRSFERQFGSTDPLVQDTNQTQSAPGRVDEITRFYGADVTASAIDALLSTHPLKPFIIDPRIDNNLRPIKNRICAPFLQDKSQTKIFQLGNGNSDRLKRCFLERVISVRFSNKNITLDQSAVADLTSQIKSNVDLTDDDLVSILSNPLANLHADELAIFDSYFKLLRALIKQLVDSIHSIEIIRTNINWQPIPDPQNGTETGTNGNKLDSIIANDSNNKETELEILRIQLKQLTNNISFTLDSGLGGVPDPGDFVFSNLDDLTSVFNKNVEASFDDQLKEMNEKRDHQGNEGLNHLKTIEVIMGEFSGLGLIDIVAIQAALYVMGSNELLGLIDDRAFERAKTFRKDLNFDAANRNGSIIASLQEFEKTLKTIYSLIQKYFDSLNNGSAFNAS